MISQEKLQQMINEETAKLLATQITEYLDGQWQKVIYELACTRKTNEQLKESLNQLANYCSRLEAVIEQKEAKEQADMEIRQKQASLLEVALKKLGE